MFVDSARIRSKQLQGCVCCQPQSRFQGFGRRGLLGLAAAAVAVPFFIAPARAEDGTSYEAMLLTCIDPRMVVPVADWMQGRGLKGKYSQFAIAGAGAGVVAPAFEPWHDTFWDNLEASIQLHKIKRVIVVNHRDCGAVAIAYGSEAIKTPEAEWALHKTVYGEFKDELAERQPALQTEGGLMALDGSIDMFA